MRKAIQGDVPVGLAMLTRFGRSSGYVYSIGVILSQRSAGVGGAGLPEPSEGFRLEEFLGYARWSLISRALEMANGNKTAAARLLGITPRPFITSFAGGNDDGGGASAWE